MNEIQNHSIERVPVLWSLANKSGSGFQLPLLNSLNNLCSAKAICAQSSPITRSERLADRVLFTPITAYSARTALQFPVRYWFDFQKVTAVIAKHASVVHVTMGSPWDALYLKAAKKAGVPIIVTIHDAERHPGEEGNAYDHAEKIFLRYADHIATVSKFVHDGWTKRTQLPIPAHLIEGGLITQQERPIPSRKFPADRKIRVLFLGRIHEYKGLSLLLDAMLRLKCTNDNLTLTIAGSGDLRDYMDRINQLGNVTLINEWIEDGQVRSILADSDILAMPYIEASQSGVALDGLWASLPIVATPVGALTEQLTHLTDSVIADSVSVESIELAIKKIIGDPVLYETLSAGANESYFRLGPDVVARKWLALYQDVIVR